MLKKLLIIVLLDWGCYFYLNKNKDDYIKNIKDIKENKIKINLIIKENICNIENLNFIKKLLNNNTASLQFKDCKN